MRRRLSHFEAGILLVLSDAIPGSQQTSVLSMTRLFQAIRPNKAPEPTLPSVTLRATSRITDMKLRSAEPNQARSAPAVSVAHL